MQILHRGVFMGFHGSRQLPTAYGLRDLWCVRVQSQPGGLSGVLGVEGFLVFAVFKRCAQVL